MRCMLAAIDRFSCAAVFVHQLPSLRRVGLLWCELKVMQALCLQAQLAGEECLHHDPNSSASCAPPGLRDTGRRVGREALGIWLQKQTLTDGFNTCWKLIAQEQQYYLFWRGWVSCDLCFLFLLLNSAPLFSDTIECIYSVNACFGGSCVLFTGDL